MKGDYTKKSAMSTIQSVIVSRFKPYDVYFAREEDRPPKMPKRIAQIFKETTDFFSMPNQCAWTDRCCENVVELASHLRYKFGKRTIPYNGVPKEYSMDEEFKNAITKLKKVI